jgi:hypothetical protein
MKYATPQDELANRIQREYREMPDLKLTLWQAGRLWNVPVDECEAALTRLVQAGFLYRGERGMFQRSH